MNFNVAASDTAVYNAGDYKTDETNDSRIDNDAAEAYGRFHVINDTDVGYNYTSMISVL